MGMIGEVSLFWWLVVAFLAVCAANRLWYRGIVHLHRIEVNVSCVAPGDVLETALHLDMKTGAAWSRVKRILRDRKHPERFVSLGALELDYLVRGNQQALSHRDDIPDDLESGEWEIAYRAEARPNGWNPLYKIFMPVSVVTAPVHICGKAEGACDEH